MSLGENAILGVAMGSSEAAGYVDRSGCITGWLNELAFCPMDYRVNAPTDEWSGDDGCGVQFMSQQAVFRLAPGVGIELDQNAELAVRLKSVQDLMHAGDQRAIDIWNTIGVYVGYAVAHYADFYDVSQILILGRVTSGDGGEIIIRKAQEVLDTEFPELAKKMQINLPDEKSRRVGQAVAAASLPELK
jgi:predicted NBD/HSP70 family sugar kinase